MVIIKWSKPHYYTCEADLAIFTNACSAIGGMTSVTESLGYVQCGSDKLELFGLVPKVTEPVVKEPALGLIHVPKITEPAAKVAGIGMLGLAVITVIIYYVWKVMKK